MQEKKFNNTICFIIRMHKEKYFCFLRRIFCFFSIFTFSVPILQTCL